MPTVLTLGCVALVVLYGTFYALLHATQNKREPRLLPGTIPFLDPGIGIARNKVDYLVNLRKRYRLPIHTMRMPFQRFYIVQSPQLIQTVQNKTNISTFVPTLLDFGMLFSGLNKESQKVLRGAFDINGNGFTISVHKYLTAGPTLQVATRTAIDNLSASVPSGFATSGEIGLLENIRHHLTLALTGAVYGPENPYDDPDIEASWQEFVPGISHLLYSPLPSLTARKCLRARGRVIDAFKKYFETDGHLQAFPMIAEMFEANKGHGLSASEAAKMEMATSLAMLSSSAITTFWLMFHVLSNPSALSDCRQELLGLVVNEAETNTGHVKVVDLATIKAKCPTLAAMLHETLRYHSTVINVKKVHHDTTLASQYYLKKGGILMIPGTAVHHDPEVWGHGAETFDHRRFLNPEGHKKLSSTSAFRPFGAGATMCPGRHFSTNTILSLVAMVLLQFEIRPVEGRWSMPTKRNADLWNAMPKPDNDVRVRIARRKDPGTAQWKFVWGSTVQGM
ncbi:cytochrome P450 [Trematosphaeria pertusa]|uniref:Cytochrome P450 n=1 Tax=Trematosphaeria pertusa TaxID=390896 RepID=A0A6A6IJY5_9PLEO|nr:cytochrome P450 [Trematosphaeria pertusa]KAF2250378.1 cytochrome P450 [Trematosphaeria pertusa]